uniref:Coiled-coil domain-containing protein 12 n=1 Tax=Parascaris univalens TaxID=6257 RepID=A0A915B6I8_PARUN
MRHRGPLQSTFSKKGLTVSAAPITIRNDKEPNANDDTPSGSRGMGTKRFNGEKGMLHTVPKMVNGKMGMLHSSPKMVDGIKGTLHALAEMEGGARQIGESSRRKDESVGPL